MDEFREYLKEKYGIINVEQATLIKTNNANSKPYVVTFNQDNLTYCLYATEERPNTKVYNFKSKLILCNNSQAYGHAKKWCKNNVVCRNCAIIGHAMDQCKAEKSVC